MYHAASAAAAKRRMLPSRGGGRQKVHRPWTLPEVEALVEGVGHYGRGQWADIKSLESDGVAEALVSRSAVDLKDKWRNLLQLASLPQQSRRKAETPPELLQRVLAALMSLLLRDYRSGDFHQRAYFRLFSGWLFDLNAPDPTLDPIQPQVLSAFCAAFHALQPARLPGFAFSWMELVSHRMFMPKLLLTKGQKGWPLMQRLLVGLFRFLHPFLSAAELSPPVRMLYRGALRVLLVLLHDFPEFLCDYHFAFCDVIPPSCIQMRNLILSAFPRNMRLPDPFTPNLKVDLLPEISQPPRILSSYSAALSSSGTLLTELDAFLKSRQPRAFLEELRLRLLGADGKCRVPLVNAQIGRASCRERV